MNKQYCYSFDGEYFGCLYDSKEEALEDARKDAQTDNKIVYIGVANKYEEDCYGVSVDVAESLQERAYDEMGEFAEDYMCIKDKKHLDILEERLKKVILDFQKEFGYEPSFYKVSDIEVINL